MYRLCFLFILFFCFVFAPFFVRGESSPSPTVNGVDIITGKNENPDSSFLKNEFYDLGQNQVGDKVIQLHAGDFRIGRVRLQKILSDEEPKTLHTIAQFFYEPGSTTIIDGLNHKTVYTFNDKLITSVEQFDGERSYRKERYYWNEQSNPPQLITRTLENGQGEIWSCCQFIYDESGRLIKETLAGNLSGELTDGFHVNALGQILDEAERYSAYYEYNHAGQLVKKWEDNGSITEYTYDPETMQCLTKKIHDGFQVYSEVSYAYDSEGFLNKTTVDDGGSGCQIFEITASHDKASLGQPLVTQSKYIDPGTSQEHLLEKTVFSYSPKGDLVREEYYDADNVLRYAIDMEYNDQHECVKVVDSRGERAAKKWEESSHYRYNLFQQQIALIDKYGNETQYEYDHVGRLVKTVYPEVVDSQGQRFKPTIAQDYDIANNIISSQDSLGFQTKQKYTIRGKPFETIFPDGSVEKIYYYLDGKEKERIAKNGAKISFHNDAFGRVIKSVAYSPTGKVAQILDYSYQGARLVSTTDNQNYTLNFTYDGAGRQISSVQITQDGQRKLEWSYDNFGNQNHIKEWFGNGSSDFVSKVMERDQWQKLIRTLLNDASGAVQRHVESKADDAPSLYYTKEDVTVNERGQHVKRTEVVDALGMREVILYDAMDRVESKELYNSFFVKIKHTQYFYDAVGNKTLEKHAVIVDGQVQREYSCAWRYDCMKRVTVIQEGLGSINQKNTHYEYDSHGELIRITKPNGVTVHYFYNGEGQLEKWLSSDQSFAYHYFYDARNRVTQIIDLVHNQTVKREYDAFNQIVCETVGSNCALKSNFDLSGRRTSLTLPDNSRVVYRYNGSLLDSISRLDAEGMESYRHHYDYDLSGQIIRSHLIGDLGTVEYDYHPSGWVRSLKSPWWSQKLSDNSFDAYRNIVSDEIHDLLGQQVRYFEYTQDQQLASDGEARYDYDSLFNRLDGEINDLNQLVNKDGVAYRFDENGNRIEKIEDTQRWIYSYDALDRLIRVELVGLQAIEYVYDAFNRRLSQTNHAWDSHQSKWQLISSDRFLFDGDREMGRMDDSGQICELRVLGLGKGAEIASAIAIELKGHIYAPIHDLQGSVRCLVDLEKQYPAEFYRYSGFGEETIYNSSGIEIETSAISNPWRFSSKRADDLTGLIFFGKRFYDPQIARWLSPDPLFFYDSPNLYSFVKNNPLVHQDLYGLFSIRSIWENISSAASNVFEFFKSLPHRFVHTLDATFVLPTIVTDALSSMGERLLGIDIFSLFQVKYDKVETGVYGEGEKNNKLRVTFINGLFTSRDGLLENLELISKTHGGINVHYVFRPTEGWSTDIPQAAVIKLGFSTFGYRSAYAYLLAEKWKGLIQEMGGVNGGGVIVHYAHSLGGTDTDRARHLLSPEEQKMIRVITIGSSTMVRNEGFHSVVNYTSYGDYVPWVDILGQIRNFFDPNSNMCLIGSYWEFPHEHPLRCQSYRTLVEKLGKQFLLDYGLG